MEIGELDMHCGNCDVIDYCGNSFCYSLCHDERFSDVEEETYNKIADTFQTENLEICAGCTRPDCRAYRCSENNYADEDCERADELWDFKCKQIADYVHGVLESGAAGQRLAEQEEKC